VAAAGLGAARKVAQAAFAGSGAARRVAQVAAAGLGAARSVAQVVLAALDKCKRTGPQPRPDFAHLQAGGTLLVTCLSFLGD